MNDFIKLNLENQLFKKTEAVLKSSDLTPHIVHSSQFAFKNYDTVLPSGNQSAAKIDKTNYLQQKHMYSKINSLLDKETKLQLSNLMKNGKLLSRKSNDGSSTLENLYKIATQPRLEYFNKDAILRTTITTISNPFLITQNFGKIPEPLIPELVQKENRIREEKNKSNEQKIKSDFTQTEEPVTAEDVNFSKGHSCAAASIEFNLADKKPAEFVRLMEGFTSPEKGAKVKIKYSNIAPNLTDALSVLEQQKAEFKPIDWENIEVMIRPDINSIGKSDDNAYLRASIQDKKRVKDSRSMADVLMQSAFMELGSARTYNALTDMRSKDTGNGRGLSQEEIAFVESIVDEDGGKVPITYMDIDEDVTRIKKYNYDHKTVEKQITSSIDKGTNVILGFLTNTEGKNILSPDGHEISVIDYKKGKDGHLYFAYNDTDDGNNYNKSYVKASEIIPKIHHANIPKSVVKENIPYQESGYFLLQQYNELKKEQGL